MNFDLGESDIEFWKDFDQAFDHHQRPARSNPQTENPVPENIAFFDTITTQVKKNIVNSWATEDYRTKIKRMRESKEREVNSEVIIIKNHLKRKYKTKLQDATLKYQTIIKKLIKDLADLKDIIVSKDRDINFLVQLLAEIDLNLAEKTTLNKNSKNSANFCNIDQEKIALAQEIQNLQSQIISYKELFKIQKSQ
jgi:hypothetical protein